MCLTSFSLLGSGERFEPDFRFDSPSAALLTYWEALAVNDSELLAECFSAPTRMFPRPGQVWFLPPTAKLGIYGLRWRSVDDDHVRVAYEVRYWAQDGLAEESFDLTTDLVRIDGRWRIIPPSEEGWPDWTPSTRRIRV